MAAQEGRHSVGAYLAMLTSGLTQYDQKLAARERTPNIYRIGHYLRAVHEVRSKVSNLETDSSPEALARLKNAIDDHFGMDTPSGGLNYMPPVRKVISAIEAGRPARITVQRNISIRKYKRGRVRARGSATRAARRSRRTNARAMQFRDLAIGQRFWFAAEGEWWGGDLAQGPWIKTGSRKYRHDPDDGHEHRVGSISAKVSASESARSQRIGRIAEAMERYRSNPFDGAQYSSGDILDYIRHGDRVTIVNRFGQQSTGRAVMRGPAGWVLNMGGKHGTPAIAHNDNIVKVTRARSRKSNPKITPYEAKRILASLRIPIGEDFHVLSSSQVDGLLAEAKVWKYRKPASASGSKARYFHAQLQRASQAPPRSIRGYFTRNPGKEKRYLRRGRAHEARRAGFSSRLLRRGEFALSPKSVYRVRRSRERGRFQKAPGYTAKQRAMLGNPQTRIYRVRVPPSRIDPKGYDMTISAQSKRTALKEARHWCAQTYREQTGGLMSEYHLPKGTKITEVYARAANKGLQREARRYYAMRTRHPFGKDFGSSYKYKLEQRIKRWRKREAEGRAGAYPRLGPRGMSQRAWDRFLKKQKDNPDWEYGPWGALGTRTMSYRAEIERRRGGPRRSAGQQLAHLDRTARSQYGKGYRSLSESQRERVKDLARAANRRRRSRSNAVHARRRRRVYR